MRTFHPDHSGLSGQGVPSASFRCCKLTALTDSIVALESSSGHMQGSKALTVHLQWRLNDLYKCDSPVPFLSVVQMAAARAAALHVFVAIHN
jgi:hypothetical protein